ncbi:MAG: biliverdin-producing heme oxygenase [Oscillochloris sp.]|nr:biliverdin-producing heme oxygenase [Oscillochloris sp.]
MHQVTTITASLQAATYDQNVRIGELSFFTTEQLDQASYAALLSGLAYLYDAFEQVLRDANDPPMQAIWGRELHKQPLLLQDAAAVAASARPVPAVTISAELLGEHLRLRAAHDPRSLLGSAYALATWYMGGPELSARLARALRLGGGAGLSYLDSFDSWGQAHWPTFAAQIEAVPLSAEGQQQVVAAAREVLDGIEQLLNQLHPLNESPASELVTLFNPLAGNHPISDDMEELKAALRAHQRMDQIFPYMELRYGIKGRKFSWSDGCWMISLTGEAQASVNQQVQWLARLLARRGMPQWFMECHLLFLADELNRVLPANRERYATLIETARFLATERSKYVNDTELGALDEAFYAQAGQEWHSWMPNCGGLIASAVADHLNGVPHALEAIEGWMTDPARFPAAWVDAARATIARAHALRGA